MRASLIGLFFALSSTVSGNSLAYQPDPNKVLRYSFEVAETTFDPQKVSDLYSNLVIDAIFDTPLRYDYLARPAKLVPNTLAAMPTVSDDQLTYTFKVKPGIYFADD